MSVIESMLEQFSGSALPHFLDIHLLSLPKFSSTEASFSLSSARTGRRHSATDENMNVCSRERISKIFLLHLAQLLTKSISKAGTKYKCTATLVPT